MTKEEIWKKHEKLHYELGMAGIGRFTEAIYDAMEEYAKKEVGKVFEYDAAFHVKYNQLEQQIHELKSQPSFTREDMEEAHEAGRLLGYHQADNNLKIDIVPLQFSKWLDNYLKQRGR
jgi:hypothetical protein